MPDDFDPIRIGIQLDRAEQCGAIETDVAATLRGLVGQKVARLARNARKRERKARREEARASARCRGQSPPLAGGRLLSSLGVVPEWAMPSGTTTGPPPETPMAAPADEPYFFRHFSGIDIPIGPETDIPERAIVFRGPTGPPPYSSGTRVRCRHCGVIRWAGQGVVCDWCGAIGADQVALPSPWLGPETTTGPPPE